MRGDRQGTISEVSGGGVSGEHPSADPIQFLVGPTTTDQFNTAHLRLIPIACWRVDDIRFDFDSSFVVADSSTDPANDPDDIRAELSHLAELIKDHPGSPLSVFGHADPTGNDSYNKALSGRRATAVYALLIFNTDPGTAVSLWQQISATEHWGANQQQTMQALTGLPEGTPSSSLLRSYMQQLCPPELQLGKKDFLAQGADSGGKGDYQGCGEFNPLLIFSQEKQEIFDQGKQQNDVALIQQRNSQNAPNRRVMVLMFRKGSRVDPAKWPCPRAADGTSGCIKRFWSDGETRRSTHLPDKPRKFADTADTFACRFYQRISSSSPCEGPPPKIFQLQLRDYNQTPLVGCPVSLTLNGKRHESATDGLGLTRLRVCSQSEGLLEAKGHKYQLKFVDSLSSDVADAQSMLNALGFNAGLLDGNLGRRTEDALKDFQRAHGLEPKGQLDQPTSDKLRSEHVIVELDDDTTPAPSHALKSKTAMALDSPDAGSKPDPSSPASSTPGATPSAGTGSSGDAGADAGKPDDAGVDGGPSPANIKNDSVSRIDLPPPHDELSQAIMDCFSDIDLDKDGFLSKKEIDVALGREDFKGVHGAMVATIKKCLGDFEEFSDDEIGWENDGITRADVTAYDRRRLKDPGDKALQRIWKMYNYAKKKITTSVSDLFVEDPDPLNVKQGMMGDCWFLSALVGVALRRRTDIRALVWQEGQLFKVRFPGKAPVTVTRPTDGEIAIFSSVCTNGIWLPVLEKGFGLVRNNDAYFFVDTSTTDAADTGNLTGVGINLLTGHDDDTDIIPLTKIATTRAKLIKAFANKKIVTAAIKGSYFSDFRPDGLPMGHAYTVMGYDSSTDMIRLRNPWGNTGPTGVTTVDGVFEMKLTDFDADFSVIAYEEDN